MLDYEDTTSGADLMERKIFLNTSKIAPNTLSIHNITAVSAILRNSAFSCTCLHTCTFLFYNMPLVQNCLDLQLAIKPIAALSVLHFLPIC